ncbi:hypothetical protein KP509_09G068500 [Ceratopteris richardii]|nr:hypothetical protein KP509_09G068500 [Ceratopteris richardii]
MLIVEDEQKVPFEYDGEHSLLLSDWWHKSAYEQEVGLQAPLPQFRWVGEPQSLLINGRGRYDCTLVPKGGQQNSGDVKVCNVSNPQCSNPVVLRVERNKIYRLRIASVASISSLNFAVEKHKLMVVEADGNYVEPFEADDLDIYPGQTYSILLSTNQFAGRNYWVALNVRGRLPQTSPHLGILNYFPVPATNKPPFPPPKGPLWNDTAYSTAQSQLYKSREGYGKVPDKVQKQIILLNTQNTVDGKIKWAINIVSLALPTTPYLQALSYNIHDAYDCESPPVTYDQSYDIFSPPKNANVTLASMLYKLPFRHTIDIVLQNANTLTLRNSEINPWHLHGHDFWVVGQGLGKFDPEKDPKSYNLKNPPLRHTVPLFPYAWTTLRFKADNMGVWLLHSTVEPRFFMGMGIVLEEGTEWMLEEPPSCTMGCGLTKELANSLLKL